jgi:hypothetical protein
MFCFIIVVLSSLLISQLLFVIDSIYLEILIGEQGGY